MTYPIIQFNNEIRIVIYSALFHETRRFYEQILQLKVVSDWDHGDGKLGVVYEIGNTYLEILQAEISVEEIQQTTNNFYLYLKVMNVDELWNKLRMCAPVVDQIHTQTWGHRNFSICDPNGYKLKFFSEVE